MKERRNKRDEGEREKILKRQMKERRNEKDEGEREKGRKKKR